MDILILQAYCFYNAEIVSFQSYTQGRETSFGSVLGKAEIVHIRKIEEAIFHVLQVQYNAFPVSCCPHTVVHGLDSHSGNFQQNRYNITITDIHLHGQSYKNYNYNENKYIPYGKRCWKCLPLLSIYFWHRFRKFSFTCISSSSEIESISSLIFSFNSSDVWGICSTHFIFQVLLQIKIKNNQIRKSWRP